MIVFAMLINLIISFSKIVVVFIFLLATYQSRSFASESVEIEIDNPRFSEKGLDNRLYEIKASKGVQKENNLELYIIEGKLRTDNGTWIYLNAEEGNFSRLENLIELAGKITFYTEENEKFQSDYALFWIDNNLIEFSKNIRHVRGNNTITSDKSLMKNNFNHIIYEGNVSTLYVMD